MENAPSPPGFCNRVFVVPKATRGLRSVIDLSRLNGYMLTTPFKMETLRTVLEAVCQHDWMATIDLRAAYLCLCILGATSSSALCGRGAVFILHPLFRPLACPSGVHMHSCYSDRRYAQVQGTSSPLPRRVAVVDTISAGHLGSGPPSVVRSRGTPGELQAVSSHTDPGCAHARLSHTGDSGQSPVSTHCFRACP